MSSAAPSTEAPLPDEAPASSEAARSSAGPAVRTASSAPPTPAQDATGIADFAFVVGRSSFDGALVDAEAADKVSAVQRWLLASPGPSVPRANIYPPVGSDWTNAGAEQLEMQLIDLVSAAEKAPEPPRLYVHVVGPLLAGDDAESIYLLCPDPQRPLRAGLWLFTGVMAYALLATRGHSLWHILAALPCAWLADRLALAALQLPLVRDRPTQAGATTY